MIAFLGKLFLVKARVSVKSIFHDFVHSVCIHAGYQCGTPWPGELRVEGRVGGEMSMIKIGVSSQRAQGGR